MEIGNVVVLGCEFRVYLHDYFFVFIHVDVQKVPVICMDVTGDLAGISQPAAINPPKAVALPATAFIGTNARQMVLDRVAPGKLVELL